MKWTEQITARAVELWETDITASDISEALLSEFSVDISRSAILGKMHRLRKSKPKNGGPAKKKTGPKSRTTPPNKLKWTDDVIKTIKTMRRSRANAREIRDALSEKCGFEAASATIRQKIAALAKDDPSLADKSVRRSPSPKPSDLEEERLVAGNSGKFSSHRDGQVALPRARRGYPGIPYLTSTHRQCQYPLWHGDIPLEEKTVCGAPVDPEPKSGTSSLYCDVHGDLCAHPYRRSGLSKEAIAIRTAKAQQTKARNKAAAQC